MDKYFWKALGLQILFLGSIVLVVGGVALAGATGHAEVVFALMGVGFIWSLIDSAKREAKRMREADNA